MCLLGDFRFPLFTIVSIVIVTMGRVVRVVIPNRVFSFTLPGLAVWVGDNPAALRRSYIVLQILKNKPLGKEYTLGSTV